MTEVFEYVEFNKEIFSPNRNDKNINGCFKYFDQNPFGLCSEPILGFVNSLKEYYKQNKMLTDKQFSALLNIMFAHEKLCIWADDYVEDIGCR